MTDDGPMDTNTTSPGPTETRTPPTSPPLVRPVAGRFLGGVATGLANSLALPVAIVRVGFVVSAFFGGLGVMLYLAGWLLIRDEREADTVGRRIVAGRYGPVAWIGIGLVALGVVAGFDRFAWPRAGIWPSRGLLWAFVLIVVGVILYRSEFSGSEPRTPPTPADPSPDPAGQTAGVAAFTDTADPGTTPPPPPPPAVYVPPAPAVPPPPKEPPSILGRLTLGVGLVALGVVAVLDNLTSVIEPQPRHYLALATLVLGLGLLTGSLIGRARWLVLVGIFVVPPLLASPVTEVDWSRGFDRTITPRNLAELQDTYTETAGRLVFDLTEADWTGQEANLIVDMAAGELIVLVPEDVAVTGTGRISAGEITDPNGRRGGLGDITRTFSVPGDTGTLGLDLTMGVGVIRVDQGPTLATGTDFVPSEESDLADIEQGTGDFTVDLRELELTDDAELAVDVRAGTITVLVPDHLNVAVNASTRAGEIDLFGRVQDGFGNEMFVTRAEIEGSPLLTLDLAVGTGGITVLERNRR